MAASKGYHEVKHLVTLPLHLEDDTRLLEEISAHAGPDNLEALGEVDLDVLAEPAGIVVPRRLGITWGISINHSTEKFNFIYILSLYILRTVFNKICRIQQSCNFPERHEEDD